MMAKTVLVTGAAGFIGAALSIRLLQRGDRVVGLDNLNDYYDPAQVQARLRCSFLLNGGRIGRCNCRNWLARCIASPVMG